MIKAQMISQEELQRFFRYESSSPTSLKDMPGPELEKFCEDIMAAQNRENLSVRGYCPRENQPYTKEMSKLKLVENAFHRIKLEHDNDGWTSSHLEHPCAAHDEYIFTFHGGVGQVCIYFYSPVTQEGASMMNWKGNMILNEHFSSLSKLNRYFRS
jgi:hypothetical protein